MGHKIIAPKSIFLSLLSASPLLLMGVFFDVAGVYGENFVLPWVPALDVSFSLRLDTLSLLFITLICGIGFLIQLYALDYTREQKDRTSFHVYLSLFMIAMLGIVSADNLILIFVFWELTTLTSYLLIGFKHEDAKSRKNALQAVMVTGIGGLMLLAGFIILGSIAGSYELTEIFVNVDKLPQHPLFELSFLLILLGAFTKSAQFPFHFWLPGAMAAPAPVSAYLHSATMVKAGVYLLARLLPIYAQTPLWASILIPVGCFTAFWTALVAFRQTDIKLMLAYTTNTVLGILVCLLGLGSTYALHAAMLLIIAHAAYKAALFMIVGTIDKKTGTRELHVLSGLKSGLKVTFIAATLALASKAGLPPLLGFLGKEYTYKALLNVDTLTLGLIVAANAFMGAIALLIFIKPFFGRPIAALEKNTPSKRAVFLWLCPLILSISGLILPVIALNWLGDIVISPAAYDISLASKAIDLKLWSGINTPLILSAVTIAAGLLLYVFYNAAQKILDILCSMLPTANGVYDSILSGILNGAEDLTKIIQHGRLNLYVSMFFATIAILGLWSLNLCCLNWQAPDIHTDVFEISLIGLIVIAVSLAATAKTRISAIAALSAIGFFTTLIFLIYGAPDVAKTQLLVETLLIVFLAIIMRHLPVLDAVPKHPKSRKAVNLLIAGATGIAVTFMMLTILQLPFDTELGDYYAANSAVKAYGRNIVNVILVDFRAIDTLGEIVVVVIASLAAASLLSYKRDKTS